MTVIKWHAALTILACSVEGKIGIIRTNLQKLNPQKYSLRPNPQKLNSVGIKSFTVYNTKMEMLFSKLNFSGPFLCKNWGSHMIYKNTFLAITRFIFHPILTNKVCKIIRRLSWFWITVKIKILGFKVKDLELW